MKSDHYKSWISAVEEAKRTATTTEHWLAIASEIREMEGHLACMAMTHPPAPRRKSGPMADVLAKP